MIFIPPQTLEPLTNQQIEDLISIHEQDQDKIKLPGRTFSHNAHEALFVVLPIINSLLGTNKWKLFEGNFFDTKVGYRVHADTGWSGKSGIWQTVVFPLSYQPTTVADFEKNRLIIFNQEWRGKPSFFMKGESRNPALSGASPYDSVFNYQDIEKIIPNFYDQTAINLCPHLPKQNLEGLTIDKSFIWTPGVPITFPRTRLHASTAFHRFGFKQKLGLSLFFSPR